MHNSDGADQKRRALSPAPAEARERLARSLRAAFPVPDSGTFRDLLDALGSSDKS